MSAPPDPWRREIRSMLRLAAPIAAVQLGQMGMGLVDVLMVGRWSDSALAGIALGNMYVWSLLGFGYGVLAALDPVVSQAVGAGRTGEIRGAVQRGLALALVVGTVLTAACLGAEPFFRLLEQPDEVRPLAVAYVHWSTPGILPFMVFVALRQSLQALSTVRPILWTMLAANALNAVLNWVLIFGHLGFPALGLRGSALASDLSRLWLAIGIAWAGWPLLRPHLLPFEVAALRPGAWLGLLRIGLPIGSQFLLEMGAFSAVMLFMGHIGSSEVAGHKVALTLASASFMVPVGISAATAVRVGYAVGRGDGEGLRRAATVALVLGGAVMAVFGLLFLALPRPLAWLFTESAEVVPIAVALIPLAGIFQVFDGIQVVSIGVLRGLAETRTPLIVNAIGFWAIGLPLGWWLTFRAGLGPTGLWWGLVAGLAAVASILLARVLWRLRRAVEGGAAEPPPPPLAEPA
jgi:MATE family multidrug resistance protein